MKGIPKRNSDARRGSFQMSFSVRDVICEGEEKRWCSNLTEGKRLYKRKQGVKIVVP